MKKQNESYEVSETGALKQNAGKVPMELLPPRWKELLAEHLEFGARKKQPKPYGDGNWRKGGKASWLLAAAERHLTKFEKGENIDEESGSNHLVAAAANCLMLAELFELNRVEDDRLHKLPEYENNENITKDKK